MTLFLQFNVNNHIPDGAHYIPPEAINIRFLSIQFTTMLEPIFLPAELPTYGMTYHQKLLKLHHNHS